MVVGEVTALLYTNLKMLHYSLHFLEVGANFYSAQVKGQSCRSISQREQFTEVTNAHLLWNWSTSAPEGVYLCVCEDNGMWPKE